jgi:trk system potassium uptake protein TrkA
VSDVATVDGQAGAAPDGGSGHVVIVGCGRVGSGLAARLLDLGHSVAVIDTDRRAFRRLDGLDIDRVEGIGYDRATLQRAGIERAVALAAVTNGDNSNIVVARAGREAFGVPRVIARVYDVRRAAVYERLGIPTVASARLTIDMTMRQLRPDVEAVRWVDPGAGVCLVERPATRALIGTSLAALEAGGDVRLAAVRRLGVSILPMADLVVQDGDVLYLMVATDDVAALEAKWGSTSGSEGRS